jgi:hypothetical protein
MSNVHYFPGSKPAPLAAPPAFFEEHRSTLAEMRNSLQSKAETNARTPDEAELLPYYGKLAARLDTLPLILRVTLNFTGNATKISLPNGRAFWASMPLLVQAENRGALCKGRVVCKALWVGALGNEPWSGLENPSGYVRGTVLELCQQMRESGCDLRLVKNLQFSFRAQERAELEDVSYLELKLASRAV